MIIKPLIKAPQPVSPKPLIVKIPGACSECTPSWGRAAEPEPPIPSPPFSPVEKSSIAQKDIHDD